ncbi:hypothetical protein MUJ63_08085 [Lachnospiraceae bacterium NSJ-143]|nr:hypothetical protein [Lachnospiraceae bacterium NSJ-143]
MNFIENVFVSGIDDIETVVYSLKRGIAVFNIYIILVDEKSNGVIVSSREFFLSGRYSQMYAAGICMGKYNAYRTYSEIVKYALSKNWQLSDIGKMLIKEKEH